MVDYNEYLTSLESGTKPNVAVAIVLAIIVLLTIFGNCLVIYSVVRFDYLRNPTNFMLLSLGVADLIVGCVVMTVSIAYELKHFWPFSKGFCKAWIALDVMCCTSSILHICLISLDRYVAITSPLHYHLKMSTPRIATGLAVVWGVSFIFAFVPIELGLNEDYSQRGPGVTQPQCYFINSKAYALVTSLVTFYVPLGVILIVYTKIFQIAHRQQRQIAALGQFHNVTPLQSVSRGSLSLAASSSSRKGRKYITPEGQGDKGAPAATAINVAAAAADDASVDDKLKTNQANKTNDVYTRYQNISVLADNNNLGLVENRSKTCTTTFSVDTFTTSTNIPANPALSTRPPDQNVPSTSSSVLATNDQNVPSTSSVMATVADSSQKGNQKRSPRNQVHPLRQGQTNRKRNQQPSRKDYKAAKTLGLVVACFCLCWLPFFIIYTVHPFKPTFVTSATMSKVTVWLGYCNSCVNPYLYSYTKDFRKAFKTVFTSLRCCQTARL